jgi:succinoglycan biosynthesis protein ExoO
MSVSIIIAAYNARATIERAIKTVQVQTTPALEIIVVDDASTDDTRDVVGQMAKSDPRIRLICSEVNRGPSGSRNAGFRAAKGEWVAIHDADDAWCENRLEAMLAAAAQNDVDVVTDNMLLHDIGSDEITRTGFPVSRGLRWMDPEDVLQNDVQMGAEFGFSLLQPMIRLDFLNKHGLLYNEGMRDGEDLIFLMEMLFCGARAIIIPDPLYIYTTRIGDKTRQASPHTKSIPRFDLVAGQIEALRREYPQQISPAIDRAMSRLVRRYRVVHASNLAKQKRLQKGLLAYAGDLGRNPAIIAQLARYQYWKRVAR